MEDVSVQNPREKAGFFSLVTFSWLNDFLKVGSKQPLYEKLLFPVETSNQAEILVADLEREWLAEERASEHHGTKARLWRAMTRVIAHRDYIFLAFLRLFYTITLNVLPLIIWFFLRSISTTSLSYKTSLPFVIGISLVTLTRSALQGLAIFKVETLAIRLKVAVVGLVYKKVNEKTMGRYGKMWMTTTTCPFFNLSDSISHVYVCMFVFLEVSGA